MDLNTVPFSQLVERVMRGKLQLGEIPQGRRQRVEREIEEMRVAASEKAEAKAKKKKGKK